MPNKLPILFLGTQMEVAGAQRVLLSLARWFHASGYPVEAAFFYDKQGLTGIWKSENDFPLTSLRGWKSGGFPVANLFRFVFGLGRLFKSARRARVIIAFTPHSNLIGLPIARLAGVPVRIGTHHGFIEGSSRIMARLHGRLTNSKICSVMVAVSEQVRQFAMVREGAHPEKLVVIENGIESLVISQLDPSRRIALRAEMGAEDDGLLFLTVGRLTVQKGHDDLLEAIARLGTTSREDHFVFAGDGPLREELEKKAKRLGILERVKFLGIRADVNDLLLAADVFVQPSLWEGLSLALLEALLAGLPVVATKVEGVVDVVEDGHSAILVPPNDPDALANAFERLLKNPTLRDELGRAGQQKAQNQYSVDRMCLAYEKLILGFENGH